MIRRLHIKHATFSTGSHQPGENKHTEARQGLEMRNELIMMKNEVAAQQLDSMDWNYMLIS